MNLKQLEYFVSVAELGSFSKAALALDIAQPALSRQVRALEVELRETLLLRNGRGVSLTEAGQRLFDHGVAILNQVAQVREDMGARREEPVGGITIGLPPSIGRQLTLPLIDSFKRQLPKARLAIVEGLSSHIAEWLATGRIDLGLVYNPEAAAHLSIQPLLREPLCLVSAARADQPTAKGTQRPSDATASPPRGPVPLKSLARYPLVVPERQHVIRRLLESQATLAGLTLDIAWEVSSIAAIIDLVCAGYGHAVLNASAVVASGRADALVARPIVEPVLDSVLCLAVPAHRRATPLQRQAAALLAELVRRLPQGNAAHSQPG
jgi:LysR family nitrogen assimilation transcriptional regulator